jgi:hypothetical protein
MIGALILLRGTGKENGTTWVMDLNSVFIAEKQS